MLAQLQDSRCLAKRKCRVPASHVKTVPACQRVFPFRRYEKHCSELQSQCCSSRSVALQAGLPFCQFLQTFKLDGGGCFETVSLCRPGCP